jgi:hypothetical protein
MSLRLASCCLGVLLTNGIAGATPLAPPPPAKYTVVIRYRIVAFRNERVAQFNTLMAALKARGFERDPDEEPALDEAADMNATQLRGTVPSKRARELLAVKNVRSLLLYPEGEKAPAEAGQAVRVVIDLAAGLPLDRQRLLHAQTAEALSGLKFSEAVGYDHLGFTRLVGSIPAGQLEQVLGDLRQLPTGRNLPAPFANIQAVKVLEVRPDQPVPAARPPAPVVPAGQEKLSSDLRELIADAARANKPVRLDVLLAYPPPPDQRGWERLFRVSVPGVKLEGILGDLVTITARPEQVPALAALPEVVGVRLPRPAVAAPIEPGADSLATLLATGLERLHTPGYRGEGNRIAVVTADFSGWQSLRGTGLPQKTQLIDLTLERNPNLEPEPYPTASGLGQGTLFARAIAAAAPGADIVLIRVDPAVPYMLDVIARAVNGRPADSLALEQRGRDLADERILLDIRKNELLNERREVLNDLREEEEPTKRREEYFKNQAVLDRDFKAYGERMHRYLRHEDALIHLKGVRLIASSLIWDTRERGGGSNPVSRFLGDRPFAPGLWLQAGDIDSKGTWTGLYRDSDDNGVMEFAGPDEKLAQGSWSRELNFLAWRSPDRKVSAELPAGSRIRVTFQWREAHDPTLLATGVDPYREPLSTFRLLLLRQFDPTGATRPSDDLEVVAQSDGAPRRLDQTPSSATYEISIDYPVTANGRFALRVEGHVAESDRPANLPTLPLLRRVSEIRPRVTVETLSGDGTAIWHDYAGDTSDDALIPGSSSEIRASNKSAFVDMKHAKPQGIGSQDTVLPGEPRSSRMLHCIAQPAVDRCRGANGAKLSASLSVGVQMEL